MIFKHTNVDIFNMLVLKVIVILLYLCVKQVKSDCYYDTTGGGCVLLSFPDVNGNCLNYYQTIFAGLWPYPNNDNGVCYDGFYSACLCATVAEKTSCASFANFSSANIDTCPDSWKTLGDSMIINNLDTNCPDQTTTFVQGKTPCATSCCGQTCDKTC